MSNKQSIKLYTEEQVDKIALQVINYGYWDNREVTPIELPSDEEIIAKSKQEPDNSDIETAARIGYVAGAKWIRDKIQGGNK